jgi:type IV pilus assembly protein PilQ
MTRMQLFALATAALAAAAPARAITPPAGQVTAVSVVPTPGRAEIVINVRGAVEVKDFVLREPNRLVIDVLGATLAGSGATYDGVNRAGVTDIRYSQFRPDVVRIAIYLDDVRDYRVDRDGDAVRVSFGSDQSFLAWSSRAPADLKPPVSRAAAAVAAPAPEVTPSAPIRLASATLDQPRITVTWDKADISDVVAGFAAFSGKTIILGKDIKGQVTAEIKNQPWPEAFAAVLATQGLQAIELPGGIIRVDSPSAITALDSIEPLQTRLVPVNYVTASSLTGSVAAILSKRGKVVADTTSNSLIITDTRSRVADVSDFVKNLDIRTPQVSIQSKLIFVDRTDVQSLGLKYDLGSADVFFNKVVARTDPSTGDAFDRNTVVVGGQSIAAVANADALIVGPALEVVWRTAIGGFDLTTFVQALQTVQVADVQAEPLITTLDNREAFINVGEDVPVRVIDVSSGTSGQAGPPKATVQFKETGIKLTVTPHVTNNRQVLMHVVAERSDLRELAAADLGFTIRKQNAENQLLVADGETAVIGGLTVTTVNRTKSGIPLLVDLPIVGKLFGFTTNSEQRQDLIILITPRIIDEGAS